MPPSEALNQTRVIVVVVDVQGPFAAGDVDGAALGGEVEFREEDLRGCVFRARSFAAERQGEGRVAEVEAVGLDFAGGGDGAGTHVGFGGAEAGVRGEGGGAGGGRHGGGGECGFEVGLCDG